jgi:hypothetical protein
MQFYFISAGTKIIKFKDVSNFLLPAGITATLMNCKFTYLTGRVLGYYNKLLQDYEAD